MTIGTELRVVVRSRPDVTSTEGAEDAKALARFLIDASRDDAVAMVLIDLVHAPPVSGPRTLASNRSFLEAFAANNKPVRVHCGPSALKQMQWRRLLEAAMGDLGTLVIDESDAAPTDPKQ